MDRVFISYVRENLADVQRLAEVLRVYGIDVWLDRDKIKPGLRWQDVIREGIAQGDYFVACFSKEYSERSRTYMNEEITLAIEELRQRPTNRAWFIPVVLSETGIPDRSIGAGETLRSLQWVPLYEDWHDGVARILSVVQPNSAKIHVLIKELESHSARARIKAIDSLGVLGPLAKEAVPHLAMMLKDQNETVRAAAAEALGKMGIATEEVVAELLTLMRRAEVYYDSRHAAIALSYLGPLGISALLEATTFDGYAVGGDAFDRLVRMGQAALPHLIHIVTSCDNHADVAIGVLRRIHDLQALPDLVKTLADGGPVLRAAAAEAIGEVFRWSRAPDAAEAQSAVLALIEALQDPPVRSSAIKALGRAGRNAKRAVPCLIDALNDDDVRTLAIEALGDIGQDAGDAVPPLIAAAAAKETRRAAIRALGQIGSTDAIPTLVTALNDPEVRSDAANALGKIGPAAYAAVSSLIPALNDLDRDVCWNAAMALGAIGKPSYEAVPTLLQAFQNSHDWAYRWRIADALGEIGAQQAVEPLIGALSDSQAQVRSTAARALGRIGNRAAISALLQQSFDDDSTVRWAVIAALGDVGTPKDKDIVNRLVKALKKDNSVDARRQAAQSLSKVGDPTAISALKKALNDKDELVRSDAQAAIDQLERL